MGIGSTETMKRPRLRLALIKHFGPYLVGEGMADGEEAVDRGHHQDIRARIKRGATKQFHKSNKVFVGTHSGAFDISMSGRRKA